MNEVLDRIATDIGELLSWAAFPREDEVAATAVAGLSAQMSRLEAVRALLVAQLETAGWAKRQGSTSTTAWLTQRCHLSIGAAHRATLLGKHLTAGDRKVSDPDRLLKALGSGAVTADQALAIGDAVRALPHDADIDMHDRAEQAMIDLAPTLTPKELAIVGDRILELVAPEIAEEAEAKRLARLEEEAHRRRDLHITVDHTGCSRITGRLDPEATAKVRLAIDAFARPLPAADGTRDKRSPGQRNADALHELCRIALDFDRLPDHGGSKPQIIITTSFDTLASQLGAAGVGERPDAGDRHNATSRPGFGGDHGASGPRPRNERRRDSGRGVERGHGTGTLGTGTLGIGTLGIGTLDTGVRVSPETVRRLACDALIIPAVLGSTGELLDLGRSQRIINTAVRTALIARDGGCQFPGCDRPPRWCQGHHIRPWADGGTTSLSNSILLCGHHHREVHHSDWRITRNEGGHFAFIPPRHIDPQQRPRTNTLRLRH